MASYATIEDTLAVLVAAVIGGLISLATTWFFARRAEREAAYATAMTLRANLLTSLERIQKAQKEKRWWPEPITLPTENWLNEPRAPLAAKLRDVELVLLSKAFDDAAQLNFIHIKVVALEKSRAKAGEDQQSGPAPVTTESEEGLLEQTREAVMTGLAILEPFRKETAS